ncbi:hypothetical protein [uncultured Croceitalea sp.]|uniref:hypothetical protein n=1 Tax=uncultured Croceitalea sp. TaxID=1798908 RepID=UPI003305B2CB
MAKNTKTYLLLGVVLLIWGAVGYRIYSGLSPDVPAEQEVKATSFKPKAMVKKDTFSILADYRDPFFGTYSKKKKKVKSTTLKKVVAPQIAISYTGSVIDNNQKNSIFFVTIEGQQVLMKARQTIQDVTLVSGTKMAIRVRHKGKLRTIKLQQ